jgi:regulatory protein
MVKIDEIRIIRSFVRIRLDNDEIFWLRQEDLAGTGYCEGQEHDAVSFLHTMIRCQYPRALNMAIAMLARRPCSKGEISQKLLQRRFIPEVTEQVIAKLENEHLVDDESFCHQWIRYRLNQKYGATLIQRELKIKGIPEATITASLERIDPDEGQENAVILARKYWKRRKKDEDPRTARQKVIISLVRRGYSWETAKKACLKSENQI